MSSDWATRQRLICVFYELITVASHSCDSTWRMERSHSRHQDDAKNEEGGLHDRLLISLLCKVMPTSSLLFDVGHLPRRCHPKLQFESIIVEKS